MCGGQILVILDQAFRGSEGNNKMREDFYNRMKLTVQNEKALYPNTTYVYI